MTLPPAIPIVFLILGALAIGAANLARLRRPTWIMIFTSVLALALLLAVPSNPPVTQIIARWQPVSVFTVPLSFRVDETAWVVALGLMLVLNTTAFMWGGFPGQHRPAPRALSLLLTAAALSGIFASNLLTLAVAWGMLDLIFVLALLVRGGSEVGRRAALAIVLNAVSTVCIWIAALLIENQHGSLYWHLLNASQEARAWLMAAAVLRVGLYPFHQWLPVELGKEPDRSVMIFVVPTIAGLALWVRMAGARALPEDSLVPLLSVLSILVGALLAWRNAQPRSGLPFIMLSLSGFVGLLAAAHASANLLTGATLNWMFVVVSLLVARGLDRRQLFWSVGALLAGLSVAAIPGTLGFLVQQAVIADTIQTKAWLILCAVVFAQTLLIASTTRLIMSEPTENTPEKLIRKICWSIAIVLGALPLIGWVLMPNLVPGLPSMRSLLSEINAVGWLALVVPIAIGLALAWHGPLMQRRSETAGQAVWGSILRLDWLNNVVFYLLDRLTGLLRAVANLFEGDGGLLWTVILIVIAIVLYTNALQA
jgi:NADH:ubiquinone oxidoreductase subunit 2 (subunit N)